MPRRVMGSRLPLYALLVFLALDTRAAAQSRAWISTGNLLWDAPSNWSAGDVPDTANESAVFDRFGSYQAALSDLGPTQINDLLIDNGEVRLLSVGFGEARLSASGEVRVDGELELEKVSLEAGGDLTLRTAARVTVDGTQISANATVIESGGVAEATRLSLDNGATASLGQTTIAATVGGSNRAGLDVFEGGSLTLHNLNLATVDAQAIGEVNITASTLTQTAGGVATVGRASSLGGNGRGILTVSDGGSLNLQSLTIRETGFVLNFDSQVAIAESLIVDGGIYEERLAAARSFGPNASLVVRGTGQLILSNTPLSLTAGQSLRLEDEASVAGQGLSAAGGSVTIGAGSTIQFEEAFDNANGTLTVEAGAVATFVGAYAGSGASGPGMVQFGGEVNPGQSPGVAAFGGDLLWTDGAELVAQIAGTLPGEYDSVSAAGAATLGGNLTIELLNEGPYTPAAGDTFTLLTAGAIQGGFDTITTPDLPGGLGWRFDSRPQALTLRVVAETGLAGDFNGDGRVDAADYTLWRDTQDSSGQLLSADANGDQTVDTADLALWRTNYGSSLASVAIPEPATVMLIAAGLVLLGPTKLAYGSQRP